MCGIAGFINTKDNKSKIIKDMTDKIIHRGPDAEGFYVDNNIALGHRRLSIIASSILTLIFFGLTHLEPGTTIVSVLVIQGAGSIFHLYAYLKTKNLFVSYLSHLMTDAAILITVMIGLVGWIII